MIRCVLAMTDGSEPATAAVDTAVDLTLSLGPSAELHVAAVIDYVGVPSVLSKRPADAPDLLAEQAQEALALAAAAAFAKGLEVRTHLLTGEVVASILATAQEVGADMLVAGVHGRNRLVRMVMGSVVSNLVRATELPVVVVRRSDRGTGAGPE